MPAAAVTSINVTEPSSPRRLLEQHPVLANVPPACVVELATAGVYRNYLPGELIVREGDSADFYWLLLKGSARAFCASTRGQEVTTQLFGAPAAWGENQLLHEQRHGESCAAVDRSLLLRLPKRDFLRIIWKYPALMMNVLCDASGRLLAAKQCERAMAFGAVSARLAHLLMSYLRMFGVPVDGGCMIRISRSQADLAADLGIALKSVSRAFVRLVRDGVLEKRGTHLVVTRPDLLESMAPLPGIDWVSGRRFA